VIPECNDNTNDPCPTHTNECKIYNCINDGLSNADCIAQNKPNNTSCDSGNGTCQSGTCVPNAEPQTVPDISNLNISVSPSPWIDNNINDNNGPQLTVNLEGVENATTCSFCGQSVNCNGQNSYIKLDAKKDVAVCKFTASNSAGESEAQRKFDFNCHPNGITAQGTYAGNDNDTSSCSNDVCYTGSTLSCEATCTGTPPTGTTGIVKGSTSPSTSTIWSYTTSTNPEACQWTCLSGFTKSGNTCVAQTQATCTGTLPSGGGVNRSSAIPSTSSPWTYTSSSNPGACQWTCLNGYSYNGSTGCTLNNNTNPTTYYWYTGSWGICSSSCNQSRTVYCRSSAGSQVPDGYCSGSKPLASQSCSGGNCNPEPTCTPEDIWKCYNDNLYYYDSCGNRGSLKDNCSNGCSQTATGYGICQSAPTCTNECSSGQKRCSGILPQVCTLSNGCYKWTASDNNTVCGSDKLCLNGECTQKNTEPDYTYYWDAQMWETCQPDCMEHRYVLCKRVHPNGSETTVQDSYCNASAKPRDTQPCSCRSDQTCQNGACVNKCTPNTFDPPPSSICDGYWYNTTDNCDDTYGIEGTKTCPSGQYCAGDIAGDPCLCNNTGQPPVNGTCATPVAGECGDFEHYCTGDGRDAHRGSRCAVGTYETIPNSFYHWYCVGENGGEKKFCSTWDYQNCDPK
jgi:hypothetical protein